MRILAELTTRSAASSFGSWCSARQVYFRPGTDRALSLGSSHGSTQSDLAALALV